MKLLRDLHVQYISQLDDHKDELEYHLSEHLRLSGVYWALCSAHLLGKPDILDADGIAQLVISCWDHENGGFGGYQGYDGHLLYTLSAVQILVMIGRVDILQDYKERIVDFIRKLQKDDGSFMGDQWGEVDTRFSYCALATLSLLQSLDKVDLDGAHSYIMSCCNYDGGFGTVPGSESHAGQIWCCLASLSILKRLDDSNQNQVGDDTTLQDNNRFENLARWLALRQLPCGGLNGRPQKLQDVCYSWWVLASLAILGKTHYIDGQKLCEFILSCQDDVGGGISDRPEDEVDIFHTLFGLCGLSFCKYEDPDDGYRLQNIDPVYCLPSSITKTLGQQR
ncbi:hypothetical protein MP228_006698 [Amoeboaphelidium protococcarum]|nr:hypothetical protein MP228_006698 [Amoeboaphelidium protococcarum]